MLPWQYTNKKSSLNQNSYGNGLIIFHDAVSKHESNSQHWMDKIFRYEISWAWKIKG